jgi:hypothetical protein
VPLVSKKQKINFFIGILNPLKKRAGSGTLVQENQNLKQKEFHEGLASLRPAINSGQNRGPNYI